MNLLEFNRLKEIARKQYNDANCRYGDNEYIYHIDMVVDILINHNVFNKSEDTNDTLVAALYHDSMEDAKQTYNDILKITGKNVADIVLGVTDVPAENRLMKHLLTMGKTVRDHRAIILKMCDILANATFSKQTGSSMYMKYVFEYQYRKPIFKTALGWYTDVLNLDLVDELWKELDEIHKIN